MGYPYTLYKEYNGIRYFADASEGFDEVEEINASSDQEAIELFKEIMRLKRGWTGGTLNEIKIHKN